MNLSPEYFVALEEAKRHHQSSKTYSGRFLRPHAAKIRELIELYGVRSILDYGCGKGGQYTWVSEPGAVTDVPHGLTLEQYWGIEVKKYDPAWPPFAAEPVGKFDLVLCTHVLGSIPVQDLPTIIRRVSEYATRAVYIAEKLGPVGKQVFGNFGVMPRNLTRANWCDAILNAHAHTVDVWLSTREKERGADSLIIEKIT